MGLKPKNLSFIPLLWEKEVPVELIGDIPPFSFFIWHKKKLRCRIPINYCKVHHLPYVSSYRYFVMPLYSHPPIPISPSKKKRKWKETKFYEYFYYSWIKSYALSGNGFGWIMDVCSCQHLSRSLKRLSSPCWSQRRSSHSKKKQPLLPWQQEMQLRNHWNWQTWGHLDWGID